MSKAVNALRDAMNHPCAIYDPPVEEIEELCAAVEEDLGE